MGVAAAVASELSSLRRPAVAPRVIWRPQSRGCELALACPVFELLVSGDRGSGKSDTLLMMFAQYVGVGYGPDWRGLIFRETYKQLTELIDRALRWFPQIFPGADYNKHDHVWRFRDGEALYLSYCRSREDYLNYHGWQVPFVGWDELTSWANSEAYLAMVSICRSANPRVPRMYRSTSNAWGPGHAWVKRRFVDPAAPGKVIRGTVEVDGEEFPVERVRLRMLSKENAALVDADPLYRANIAAAVQSDDMRRAWLHDDWDIRAGGRFAGVWEPTVHVLAPFSIPQSWRLDRSFDWGESHPYSCGVWAESDGTEATLPDGSKRAWPRGTLFRVAELYGWTGEPNTGVKEPAREVGRKVLAFCAEHPLLAGRTVYPGPADANIFAKDPIYGKSVAGDMEAVGCKWLRSDKSPGSRKRGWSLIYARLAAAVDQDAAPEDGRLKPRASMEDPGLFVFSGCRAGFLRTVPAIQGDARDPDDVDTDAEDHCADEVRYRVLAPAPIQSGDAPIH